MVRQKAREVLRANLQSTSRIFYAGKYCLKFVLYAHHQTALTDNKTTLQKMITILCENNKLTTRYNY